MAMNVGPAGGEDQVVSTINTTPLVDVMLVLLSSPKTAAPATVARARSQADSLAANIDATTVSKG